MGWNVEFWDDVDDEFVVALIDLFNVVPWLSQNYRGQIVQINCARCAVRLSTNSSFQYSCSAR